MRLGVKKMSKIKNLRKKGYSIPEISQKFGVPRSTVLRHIVGVAILPQHKARWLARRNASRIISQRQYSIALGEARRMLSSPAQKSLALVAASLYWAEGAKKDFSLSNTDPELISLFLYIMRTIFGVANDDIKVTLRIYEDLDKSACLRYWTKITGIKLGSHTSVYTLKGSKKGKLQYGMCRIRVRKGGFLLKQMVALRKILQDSLPL